MSKRVQLLGHIAEIANAFVGFVRELTVDTDNAELRLHDGVTEGGRRFLDRDANDNRYQARSVELDGLLGWEPQERGFTVRLGPSNYRLRRITVDSDSLQIDNANGYDGNPFISFRATIESSHTWNGVQTFSQPIAAEGGVVGDLTGDTQGTHTGPVVGNVTGNLTGNANGNHTGTFTGSADFSDGGVLFADEQLLLPWLEPAIVQAWTDAGVPIGTIVAFGGSTVPANWRVCDGTSGTPDLRQRFIVGAGGGLEADTVGGAASHNHTVTVASGGAHVHTGNVAPTALTLEQMPNHQHSCGVTHTGTSMFSRGSAPSAIVTSRCIDTNGNDGTLEPLTSFVGDGEPHTHALSLDSSGAHAHTASSASASTLPPFYALVYIMKVA